MSLKSGSEVSAEMRLEKDFIVIDKFIVGQYVITEYVSDGVREFIVKDSTRMYNALKQRALIYTNPDKHNHSMEPK